MKLVVKRTVAIFCCVVFVAMYLVVLGGSGDRDEKLVKAEELTKELMLAVNEDYDDVCTAYYLKGLDEQEDYILVTGGENGYAVFTTDYQLIEYSPYDKNPYGSTKKTECYYGGPANYYEKEDNNDIKNVNTGKKIDNEEKQKLSSNVKSKLKEIYEQDKLTTEETKKINEEENLYTIDEHSVLNLNTSESILSTQSNLGDIDDIINFEEKIAVGNSTLISDYKFFLVPPLMGNNNTSACASVAIQLLLSYNNWSKDGRLIPAKFLYRYETGTTTLREDLKEKPYHREYISGSGTESSSTIDLTKSPENATTLFEYLVLTVNKDTLPVAVNGVKNGIKNYLNVFCQDIEDEFTVNGYGYPLTNNLSILKNEINNDRPVIAMIQYDDENGNYTWHHVVAYGYQTLSVNGVSTKGIIAHFGWDNKNYVWFNENWCLGFVTMQSTHEHSNQTLSTNSHILECTTCGGRSTNDDHVFVSYRKTENSETQFAQKYHYAICSCEYMIKDTHTMTYKTKGVANHFKECKYCHYSCEEEHTMKYGCCYYCGQIDLG